MDGSKAGSGEFENKPFANLGEALGNAKNAIGNPGEQEREENERRILQGLPSRLDSYRARVEERSIGESSEQRVDPKVRGGIKGNFIVLLKQISPELFTPEIINTLEGKIEVIPDDTLRKDLREILGKKIPPPQEISEIKEGTIWKGPIGKQGTSLFLEGPDGIRIYLVDRERVSEVDVEGGKRKIYPYDRQRARQLEEGDVVEAEIFEPRVEALRLDRKNDQYKRISKRGTPHQFLLRHNALIKGDSFWRGDQEIRFRAPDPPSGEGERLREQLAKVTGERDERLEIIRGLNEEINRLKTEKAELEGKLEEVQRANQAELEALRRDRFELVKQRDEEGRLKEEATQEMRRLSSELESFKKEFQEQRELEKLFSGAKSISYGELKATYYGWEKRLKSEGRSQEEIKAILKEAIEKLKQRLG